MTFVARPQVIESPCNKICTVDPTSGLCVGCGRSLTEIANWIRYSESERRRVMAELPTRLAALRPAGTKPVERS
jgi:predicted Fe-S protein YdhL (DUF1289 family)